MMKTPFPTLESIINEGIPKGDQILISGPPGAGKTILAMQFINDGIKNNENGIFFTLNSDREYLAEQMKCVGTDTKKLIDEGKMDIIELDPTDIYLMLDEMAAHIARMEAKRIVLDSLSVLAVYCSSYKNLPEDLIAFLKNTKYHPPITMGGSIKKQMLYTVLSEIRKLGCTTLLISELAKGSKWFSRDTISEFTSDGIIFLDYHVLGAARITRTISVIKMRRSRYSEGVHEFRITDKGIEIV